MIRVIIVEDEMLVRLGMKLCLESSTMDIKIQGAYADAETALDAMEHTLPDVLITDIRLTGMSGLEMLEELGSKREKMLVIVLSCYEDFSYARRSYELGVHKYILKQELDEDELAPLVVRLYSERHASRPTAAHKAGLTLSNLPQAPQLDVKPQRYVLGWVDIEKNEEQSEETLNLPMAQQVVQELLNPVHGECFLRRHKELLCIISFPLETTNSELHRTMNEIASAICSTITNYFNRKAGFIVSDSFEQLQMVRDKHDILKDKLVYSFYAQPAQAVWAESLPPFSSDCPVLELPSQAILTTGWKTQCVAQVKGFFDACRRRQVDPRLIKVQSDRFMHALAGMIKAHCDITMELLLPKEKQINYFIINHFYLCDDLCGWMLETVALIQDAVLKNREKDTVTTRIVEYVVKNYTSSLTLGEIAECFHLSPAYVCQLFKKKTGVTLISYINRLRIEKAKQQLAATDLPLEQIADNVGIGNVNYLSRLFKLITGETASAYRSKFVNKS